MTLEYQARKDRERRRQAEQSAAGRDIGPIPKIRRPARKARARRDFRFALESYFPETFYLPWSSDQLKVIAKTQRAVLAGGLFAMAMPRGSGKTSIAERGCIWAVVIGACQFVSLIGSDEGHAVELLDTVKTEFECNDRLLEDFPEAVFPIRCLEGIPNRCKGQRHRGRPTRIQWKQKKIVLPTIPRSKASGAIIKVAGLTGGIRGMKYQRADGRSVRPSLVVIDDPQTDESARSPSQCAARESILAGAVLGLAGPGKKISGIMPCTVIASGDMADNILDRKRHPDWQGERTKMVYSFPTNTKLWDKYAEIRADSLRNDGDGSQATEFYRKHRKAMDAGAKIAWPARYNADELSAIQHAQNLRLRDEAAFFAEYQNEPIQEEPDQEMLTADAIAAKQSGLKRGLAPTGCEHLVAFVDVHDKLLYYGVAAWREDFGGGVIDYGTYPDQKISTFTMRKASRTLARAAPGAGKEGALYAGLMALGEALLAKQWKRQDGATMRIQRCLVDARYRPDTVYQFCRDSPHSAVLLPSKGLGIGPAQKPFSEYKRKAGDRIGHHWRMPSTRGTREIRHVQVDTYYWKSFVHARLAVPMADKGSLSLFKSKQHRMFADHLTAEFSVETSGRGRTVIVWRERPERENHWFDCLVGTAVAGSILGAVLPGTGGASKVRRKRKKLKLSELRRQRR